MDISRSSTQTRFDAAIGGGGHNGIIGACAHQRSRRQFFEAQRKTPAGLLRDARCHELFTRSAGDLLDQRWKATLEYTLAPKSAHVASMFCQHFSYNRPNGRDWRQEKSRAADLNFATAESHAANFPARVLGHSHAVRSISKKKIEA